LCAALLSLVAGACRRPHEGAPQPAAEAAVPRHAAVEICVGTSHSCARAGDGSVACWGDNTSHQIALSDDAQFDAPHLVDALPRAVVLRCGSVATCVLDAGGDIHCIGGGDTTVLHLHPPAPARDLVPTSFALCARLATGAIVCWDGPEGTPPMSVAAATGATGFATAAFDARRVCVMTGERAPVCFDAQLWDALASGPHLDVRAVERLDDLAGARALAVAGVDRELVCALRPGVGDACQRATGAPFTLPWTPAPGEVASGFAAAFGETTCLRIAAGGSARGIRCFGTPLSPLAEATPARATALALSASHACALDDEGIHCWGRASRGQVGGGSPYVHGAPVPVSALDDAVLLGAGAARACALRVGGTLTCWGRGPARQDFAPAELPHLTGGTPVLELSPGGPDDPVCVRRADGWWCSNGTVWYPRPRSLPRADRHFQAAGVRVSQLAPDEACGVDQAGKLVCAGCTRADCIGSRARAAMTSFGPGKPAARFVQATSIFEHGAESFLCGLTDAGGVRCFHAEKAPFAHVAAPTAVVEPTLDALRGVVQVAAGGNDDEGFACALDRAGAVHCWGAGRFGQLGSAPIAWRAAAARVEGLPPAVQIAVGTTFACARTADHHVWCWGSNREGAVPDGNPAQALRPVTVAWPK
jgi:hypothetical protein